MQRLITTSLVGLVAIALVACGSTSQEGHDVAQGQSTITQLISTDLNAGTGAEAKPRQTVNVHYTGWLYDEHAPDHKGTKFDSSKDRGEPFSFRLGAGEVIPGWDTGVAGMKVGGARRLTIPPALAYGPRGAGGVIPPNATLVFDVELLGVR